MKELNFKYQGCNLRKIDFFHMYLKGTLSGLRLFLATESPLKIVKNDCYFILNVFFSFSEYLNFCLDFSVMLKNGLIGKVRLI